MKLSINYLDSLAYSRRHGTASPRVICQHSGFLPMGLDTLHRHKLSHIKTYNALLRCHTLTRSRPLRSLLEYSTTVHGLFTTCIYKHGGFFSEGFGKETSELPDDCWKVELETRREASSPFLSKRCINGILKGIFRRACVLAIWWILH